MSWYTSKYAKAFYVAAATGIISGTIMYLGIVDDLSLTMRQVVKIVGLSAMAPFATLIRFLPSFQDIFNSAPASQVNIESAPNMQTTIEAPAPAEAAPPVKRSHHAKPPLRGSGT